MKKTTLIFAILVTFISTKTFGQHLKMGAPQEVDELNVFAKDKEFSLNGFHISTGLVGKHTAICHVLTFEWEKEIPHITAAVGPAFYKGPVTVGVALGFENTPSVLHAVPWIHFRGERFTGMFMYLTGEEHSMIGELFWCAKIPNNEACELQIGFWNHKNNIAAGFKRIDCKSGLYVLAGLTYATGKNEESRGENNHEPVKQNFASKLGVNIGIGKDLNW